MLLLSYTIALLTLPASDSAGVYLTADDFARHYLTYPVAKNQLHYDSPFRPWALVLRAPDGRQKRFTADSVYGYHKDGEDYRFIAAKNKGAVQVDDGFYKIEAVAPLYIYSYRYVFSAKELLFSLNPTGTLLRLNVKNLAKSFPDKPALAQEVDHDRKLSYNMAARDADGQLRVAKIMAKYLP